MKTSRTLSTVALGIGVAVAQAGAVTAQGMQSMPGTMQSGTDRGTARQGMMDQGMMQGHMGPAATGQCMMQSGGDSGMMGQHMGRGMMGSGMMGPGMMGSGMMQGGVRPGMGALFGSRVTPPMILSVDDVRGYLGLQLKRLDNKRLKVGEVKGEDDTIAADIVTVDNSLVQRLKVDRHTGAIQYEN
jgi:hypothetical protein